MKAIVFDRDGVLARFDLHRAEAALRPWSTLSLADFEAHLRAFAARAPPPVDAEGEDHFWRTFWRDLAPPEARSEGAREALRAWSPYELLTPFPDARPALTRARDRGLKVGVLSNFALLDLRRSLAALGLAPLVDASLSAAQVGAAKPSPAAYRAIAAALGVSPSECLFVDDTRALVTGARAVGMRALHLRRAATEAEPLADDEIRSLDAL